MKLAGVAIVLISASMALAQQVFGQQIKEPAVHVRPAPGMSTHSAVAPPPVNNSSAAQLAKIEQQTARVRSSKPVVHHPSSGAAATPALDLGKNKPVRSGRSPQPTNPSKN